jgi:hypothetical protein
MHPGLAALLAVPEPTFTSNPNAFIALTVAGFIIGVAGHIVRSRAIVALGIGLVFLAAFLLPLATNVVKGG